MVQVAGQLRYEKRGGRWPRREGGIETKRRRRGCKRRGKMENKKRGAEGAPDKKSAPKAPENEKIGAEGADGVGLGGE